MRQGGGKQKGSQFERDICRRLSLWLSESKHEDLFWRSAMSGGRSTVAASKGKRLAAQAGDISCIHPLGQYFAEKYIIECKFYADLNLAGVFTNSGKLLAFWAELNKQAEKYDKMPFLVAKQNRLPAFICLDRDGLDVLGVKEGICVVTAPFNNIYVMEVDRFFANCKPFLLENHSGNQILKW